EVVAIGDVNRAKLYYLRGRVGRKARVRERRDVRALSSAGATAAAEQPVADQPQSAGEQPEAVETVAEDRGDVEPVAEQSDGVEPEADGAAAGETQEAVAAGEPADES
ncbi:MAG TPA: 50S ribosomal protein L19, partial [Gaiellaceae bacterium]